MPSGSNGQASLLDESISLNMNQIVGSHDIVLLTLDTLRFDVAQTLLTQGELPVLGQFISAWQPRHSPGSFTYAAHHAIFSGFFPTPIDDPLAPRLMAVDFHGSRSIDKNTQVFQQATIVEGLAEQGYQTLCIGGVGFFNKLTPLGQTLPNLFQHSYWSEQTGVTAPDSTERQIDQAIHLLKQAPVAQKAFLFINISAIHQPNYFYSARHLEQGCKEDDLRSHGAALCYVDSQLQRLFDYFKSRRDTLFILCSDHGTCYGEQGYSGHRLAHETVWTVPYAQFIQRAAQ
ncbi:STM4013/SEN3800 family hydrolase [Motilimonas sp. E26]|uniref:STM4013/SEN3800 family hydrolase n=1 Tax=Motilimonas sp. E26 TaxID=2865674 RepID=UPI001E3F53EF|nr:STM4013/SEN3800 family hydrolase [Motilimonas sp. E26]MCE0557869.1 STM4013/SEN3800 family hydrolase [Motilimonas sp. E26]